MERDQVVARVGVEDRADPLGGLVDVPVGGVLLAALEHEMLEEVGHPVLVSGRSVRAPASNATRIVTERGFPRPRSGTEAARWEGTFA